MRLFPVITAISVSSLAVSGGVTYLYWYGKNTCPLTTDKYMKMALDGNLLVENEREVNSKLITALKDEFIASGLQVNPVFSHLKPLTESDNAWTNCFDDAWKDPSENFQSEVDLNNTETWAHFMRSEYCKGISAGILAEWSYFIAPFD